MSFASVPIIVVCCYTVGELYKWFFRKKTETYKFIPILMSVIGGILGIAIFYTNPEMIFDVKNVWTALGVGIVSGASATGANQTVKQLFGRSDKREEEKNDCNAQK